MIVQLNQRKNKLSEQLNRLEKQPQIQAEKKGQISEGLRISEKEKNNNEVIISEIDKKINLLRFELNELQEKTIQIRERKASSGATIEGLKKRRNDLLERINTELNLNENTVLENSDLEKLEEFLIESDVGVEVASELREKISKDVNQLLWVVEYIKLVVDLLKLHKDLEDKV